MENFENIFVVNIFGVEWVEEFRTRGGQKEDKLALKAGEWYHFLKDGFLYHTFVSLIRGGID